MEQNYRQLTEGERHQFYALLDSHKFLYPQIAVIVVLWL